MKKILSLILATAMVVSMAAVSFAATIDEGGSPDKTWPKDVLDGIGGSAYNGEDGYPISTTLIGPFGYNSDDKNLTLDDVQYGKTAYYLLTEGYYKGAAFTERLVTDSDSAKNLKVKANWEEGKSLVDGSLAIVKKRVDSVGTYDSEKDFVVDSGFELSLRDGYDFAPGNRNYYYMVAITIKDSSSTSDADLIGTLTLSKSKKPKADDIEFGIAINVDWEESYRKDTNLILSGDTDLNAETYYSLKFDSDEEIEFTFEDDSTFTVDVSGQGKLLFYFDTDFNSSVASKYPDAELNFWNGNGAKFNRTGELFLYVGDNFDGDAYLYQLNSDGTLSAVSGAEYDDADEGFYLKTRTLGSYVFSDTKLDLTASTTPDEDTIVTPIVPVTPVNPGTGAKA